ncbi:MAG: hypothetical protein ACRC33_14150 [Gemmataceae bacterium]
MARKRHQRAKHEVIHPWPEGHEGSAAVAGAARYVGSPEHKDYESPAGAPAPRSDAARCDPRYTEFDPITAALREAIRRGCCGAQFEGRFPRHVWGWLDSRLYEARLINRDQGWYKAWPIEAAEGPRDPEGRLDWRADDAPVPD